MVFVCFCFFFFFFYLLALIPELVKMYWSGNFAVDINKIVYILLGCCFELKVENHLGYKLLFHLPWSPARSVPESSKRRKLIIWHIAYHSFSCFENFITKTRLFKCIENFTAKNRKFSDKKSDIFHISAQSIDCRYSLEPPRRGGSNEYPQSMFLSKNKKNNIHPCKPQFYYI